MSTDKKTTYLENEIKTRIRGLKSEHYNRSMFAIENEIRGRRYDEEENIDEFEAWEFLALQKLYLLIIAYLEAKDQKNLLEFFRSKFEAKLDNEEFMTKTGTRLYDDSDVESLTRLEEFEDFLYPFEAFSYSTTVIQSTELERLESILSETKHVLKHNHVEPDNEAKVYNEIKWLLQFTYPGVRNKNGARLIEKFKSYKPDILIPEVGASVEYKFIRENANPADYIDQLVIDASVYHKDPDYHHFFAVLYFEENKIHTKDSIRQAWKERNFSSNWRLVLPGL